MRTTSSAPFDVVRSNELRRVATTPEEFIRLLSERHARMMAGRAEHSPDVFKTAPNRAGGRASSCIRATSAARWRKDSPSAARSHTVRARGLRDVPRRGDSPLRRWQRPRRARA